MKTAPFIKSLLAGALVLGIAAQLLAQYPPSFTVKVRFYDMRANVGHWEAQDGSHPGCPFGPWEGQNPEFQMHKESVNHGSTWDAATYPCQCPNKTYWPGWGDPDFEGKKRVRFMVADKLDADGKPVRNTAPGARRFFNQYIKYWFRPWDSPKGGKGDFTRPIYDCSCFHASENPAAIDSWRKDSTWHHDSSFVNIVIDSTLTFKDVDSGHVPWRTYWYDDPNDGLYTYCDAPFFPLDGKGWSKIYGNEPYSTCAGDAWCPPDHNYGFTTEIVAKFQYRRGTDQVFKFCGDDDVWVFIDRTLAVDIGGIHGAYMDSVVLDDAVDAGKLALTDGNIYDLHFFHAERNAGGSNFMIQTNLYNDQAGITRKLR